MMRESAWCPGCGVYHNDVGKQPSEVDSGWRLVRAVSDVRDVGRTTTASTSWKSMEVEDIEESLARQWGVPGLALGGSDREGAS